MENFSRALGQRIAGATLEDVCRYLDGLLNHRFEEWQVTQAVDAIGLLMSYGYQRLDLGVPELRLGWGEWCNRRAGIKSPPVLSESATVCERLMRVLRVAHYSLKTEEAYTQWWERFEKFCNGKNAAELGPDDVRNFLEHLAVERHVAATTSSAAERAMIRLAIKMATTRSSEVQARSNSAVETARTSCRAKMASTHSLETPIPIFSSAASLSTSSPPQASVRKTKMESSTIGSSSHSSKPSFQSTRNTRSRHSKCAPTRSHLMDEIDEQFVLFLRSPQQVPAFIEFGSRHGRVRRFVSRSTEPECGRSSGSYFG